MDDDASPATPAEDEVRILEERVLADGHGVLRTTRFEHRRFDGAWQTLDRETYSSGNGCAVLAYDPGRGCVLLVRQFRFPAYAGGHRIPLIEVIAGLVDDNAPDVAVIKEAHEEAGVVLRAVRPVFDAYMSPGAITERLSFFVAEYSTSDRTGAGGGLPGEGEDIEVLEVAGEDAIAMIGDGRIVDAKTIMLLQHARLTGLI
nr:NUDIX domain-containing protein [uncultured Lichenicoccus sp.]